MLFGDVKWCLTHPCAFKRGPWVYLASEEETSAVQWCWYFLILYSSNSDVHNLPTYENKPFEKHGYRSGWMSKSIYHKIACCQQFKILLVPSPWSEIRYDKLIQCTLPRRNSVNVSLNASRPFLNYTRVVKSIESRKHIVSSKGFATDIIKCCL